MHSLQSLHELNRSGLGVLIGIELVGIGSVPALSDTEHHIRELPVEPRVRVDGPAKQESHVVQLGVGDVVEHNALGVRRRVVHPTDDSLVCPRIRHVNVGPHSFVAYWVGDLVVDVTVHAVIVGDIVDTVKALPQA